MTSIELCLEISSNLITRNSLKSIFAKINKSKDKKIIVDFKNIEFISRSCADEYLKRKSQSKKKIVEVNQSTEIKKMFKFVEKFEMPKEVSFDKPRGVAITVI